MIFNEITVINKLAKNQPPTRALRQAERHLNFELIASNKI